MAANRKLQIVNITDYLIFANVKRKKYLLQKVLVTGYAAEGKSLAKIDGKVIFIAGAVPGDVVDVFVSTNKKDWGEGSATHFYELSAEREQPFCQHFGTCGGCKWQMLPYQKQLEYKQQEVAQNFRRIGKIDLPDMLPIIGADATKYYRNKLEFTFSNKRYLSREEIESMPPIGFPNPSKGEASPNPSKGGALVPADGNLFQNNEEQTQANQQTPTNSQGFPTLPLGVKGANVEQTHANQQTSIISQGLQNPPLGGREASPNPSKGGALVPADGNLFQNNEQSTQASQQTPTNSQSLQSPPLGGWGASPLGVRGALPLQGGGALPLEAGALGFHVPRIFDKIIEIQECFLMDDVNNQIRNNIRDFAEENNYSFYDIKQHTGWLRNIMIRYCSTGELMVNIVLGFDDEKERNRLLDFVQTKVPSITTLLYTINPKWNDTIYDLTPQVYSGKGYVMERLENFQFKIGPKSFFQTNTKQAENLYRITRDFAGLTGTEIVYDLYCGTGSIGIFVSKLAKKIIGVEVIAEAIDDANQNAALNHISHAEFFAGDVIKICDDKFFAQHGKPDVVITDPPRVGMHEKLVIKLLEMAAPKIVYVSCNTATQARDLALLSEKYAVEKIQPVDMFPHTHHIECVVLLRLKGQG